MSLLIFGVISVIIFYLGNKNSAVYLTTIFSSFFVYYLGLVFFNVDLLPGGTFFIYTIFFYVLSIFLLMKMQESLKINTLDRFYIAFFGIWIFFYLINFDVELFRTNKVYKQAPFFLAFTLIAPVLLKPIYSKETAKRVIDYLETLGFVAACIIFFLLIFGFPSKEIWWNPQNQEIESILRYAPIRGFFSNRQAVLFAMAIIIFISKICYDVTKKKELFYKIPLVLICIGGIIISGSRGILIICSLMCVYLLYTHLAFRKQIIALFPIAILMISMQIFFNIEKYQNLTSRVFSPGFYQSHASGFNIRFARYQLGLEHFTESPILGNGMSKMSAQYDYSHNIFISVLEDTGLVGFLWLSSFIIFLIFPLRKKMDKAKCPNQLIIRNLILFLFLLSNIYGSIIAQTSLFVMLSMYYFSYRSTK